MKTDRHATRVVKACVTMIFAVIAGVSFVLFYSGPGPNVEAAGEPLSAPTGVTASDNDYNNKVGLRWDTIWGADTYTVLRNTVEDPGTATEIGSTPANFFFDHTAVVDQTYYYWVRAENASTQSAPSTPDTGTRAMGKTAPGPFDPLGPPPMPAGNPITAAKAYLGKALFWDEQLSSTRTVACGTCHQPAAGGSDPRAVPGNQASVNPGPDGVFGNDDDVVGSAGVPVNFSDGTYGISPTFGVNAQVTGRKAPTYLNAAYTANGLFWDGRATDIFRDPITDAQILDLFGGLESQSVGPPLSDAEMAHQGRDWLEAAAQIESSTPLVLAENIPAALETWIGDRTYPELFEEAFGTSDVTPARIAMAIATHERTLFSDQTPFDRALQNIEFLQPSEEQGRQVFVVNQCNVCHGGQVFSDGNFHNIGVRPATEDGGRFNVTGVEADRGSYRTPTLRNGELKSSFMHNGRLQSLAEVVEFYDRGGDFDAPNIDHALIRPLNLTAQEKADLVAFLSRPMTDPRVANELPPFDRPTLYSEGSRVPVVSGNGRPGTGGIVPVVTAIEPPIVGNPSFTVAVSDTISNTQAVLVIDDSDPGIGSSVPASGIFTRTVVNIPANGSPAVVASVSIQIPNDPALVGQTFFGRWYVNDPAATNGFSVSRLFTFTVFGEATAITPSTVFDFDGDSKTDVSVFRPNAGSLAENVGPEGSSSQWWFLRSSDQGTRGLQFGNSDDIPVASDFTGDGKTDIAFWRPSTGEWFILRSEDDSFFAFPFGASGDIPAPGDFDGDGKADPAVYRPSSGTWFIVRSSDGGLSVVPFGVSADQPIVADYDGDGMDDVGVYRSPDNQFWLLRSSEGVKAFQFGAPGDRTAVGDWTGDGKADVAFFRPSTSEWYVIRSEDDSFFAFPWGANGDVPSPGDFDGDGRFDPAVWRPSDRTWYIFGSTNGFQAVLFGANGDVPLPSSVSVN
ncbi:MAG: hypothetical protein DWQ47_03035 [Acidobacteria bacterium]|nr:MAG: hypothetical protein DWQ32_06585 [Acidobacteriota bacterium]REK01378.1 MAG: hypothetical protein DWQ38_03020 [Acidobacteriota bacterium]REK14334.1 MAG: hypothetical protein DWQ43_12275 [Acidobacteriota bacterium]REK45049.1 MAG: hypothetical protein DWQ47_03035 [Acidobacteriota bacterium]